MWLERARTILAIKWAGEIATLAGACVAALILSLALPSRQSAEPEFSNHTAVVVSLPRRPTPPAPEPAVNRQAPPNAPSPGGAGSLAKQLQTELRRVGCYDGEVHGSWTKSTRAAMKAFTERVNARLPVDKPDNILLALVQGHQGRACAVACGEGQAQQADGRCEPEAAVSRIAHKPEVAEPQPSKAAGAPIVAPPPVAATRPRPPAPPDEPRLAAPPRLVKQPPPPARGLPEATRTPEPPAVGSSSERESGAREDAPAPATGMRGGRTRKYVGSAPYRQMKSIYRSLKRAASSALPFP